MKHLKNVFVILTLLFTALFIASCDENAGDDNGDEASGTDNESSPLMFMGYENVITIKNGIDFTGITNTIYSLTSDTTLKFKGGINSITLTTIAAAMGTNDSVKIALDFSEATGITEWTNKLAGLKTLYAISLPGTVTSVQAGAFTGCTNLKAITVPKTVTEFPSDLSNDIIINLTDDFWEWVKNSAIIPDGQTLYLNGEKLSDSIGSIIMPEGITTIPDSAFKGCEWLTSITISNSVTSIGSSVFAGCSSLTSITIPNSVTSIGITTFSACSSLTSITIPNSITIIGQGAFRGCSSLPSITIPNSVTSIGAFAFYRCGNLTTINYRGSEEQWNAITIGSNNESLTTATIVYNYTGD